VHTLTDSGHRTGDFAADNERQGVRVQAGPEIGVDEVDPDCRRLDQHLPGRWLRHGPLDIREHFGAAG
jgi:hypothetical protein